MTEWEKARERQRVNATISQMEELAWQMWQEREEELLDDQIERYERYLRRRRKKPH